ncbi:MFS general substrate transporter [Aaosphaeria arxii CBS 175.79]|uniref:MFS general substrate transporter n=1 Tax=Aaosphaeria arxii CBS 175.79 TaxID=1450172 RepID=A0A6A5X752_9PLEO|nr:MFS general substrate transporter [Aaosphaeria arxii CBS 175.79]KAF2008716.1 MFS general substrate transporter [Aaosphaeria arxii CBS 175.79]
MLHIPSDSSQARSNPSSVTPTPLELCIARLGRERPLAFTSIWAEAAFIFSIMMSQFLTEYFVSGFTLILPTLIQELDIPHAAAVWPASAFSLAIASTLLIFGRLGDMWGGYPVYLCGLAWLLIWSIVAGFSINPLMLDFSRALQGLGAAAALPTGIMLMSSMYRPGPRKNFVFAIYGASGVFGFFGGIVLAGVVGQFLHWGFYFWIGAILTGAALISSYFSIPHASIGQGGSIGVKMDYLGAISLVFGLILTVFAITQSSHAPTGWRTPYIAICFSLGVIFLLSAVYIEARIASQPLLPASIVTIPSMTPLLLAILILYGCWGIFSVYGTLFFQNVWTISPLQIAVWYIPLGVAGLLFSVLEGFILHLVPGRVLLIISALCALGAQLLLALVPLDGWNYWAWIFPATIFSTIGIDFPTILMTVFITTKLPRAQQGLAGGVLNSVLQLGVALSLGLTDILQSAAVGKVGLAQSYKYTFWFGIGAAAVSLVLVAVWGSVPKATSDLTADEKLELMQEAERELNSVS